MRRTLAVQHYMILTPKQQETSHIFEYECVGKLGYKLCKIFDFDTFMNELIQQDSMDLTPLAYHEVFFMNRPTRIIFDCEADIPLDCTIDQKKYVAAIHSLLTKCFEDARPGPIQLSDPLVIVGTRPGKFSVHLIWDVWCANFNVVHALAIYVQSKNVMNVSIDTNIYPKHDNKPKTLRMPYCCKMSEDVSNILVPMGKSRAFNPDTFSRYLCTFHQGHSTKWNLPPKPKQDDLITLVNLPEYCNKIELVSYNKKVKLCVNEPMRPNTTFVLDWWEQVVPCFERKYLEYLNCGGWKCYSAMFCEVAYRWHAKNHVYIHGDDYGCITTVCADEKCRVTIRHKHTENQVAVSKTPWDVDWDIIKVLIK